MNRNIKIIIFALVTAITVTILFGIIIHIKSNNLKIDSKSKTETQYVLTEKQKEILRKNGLSDNYEELTLIQKSGICAIGEFIKYVEDNYDEEFIFDKYFLPGEGKSEYATFLCKNGEIKIYRKYVDGEYVYSDNLDEVLCASKYAQELTEFISQYIDKSQFKAYSMLWNIDDNYKDQSIISCASATSKVYISDKINGKTFGNIVDNYYKWIKEKFNGYSSYVSFYLIEEEKLNYIDKFNYDGANIKYRDSISKGVHCLIDTSGKQNQYKEN